MLDELDGKGLFIWDSPGLRARAALLSDVRSFSTNASLVQADTSSIWSDWHLQALADPERYAADPSKHLTHVYRDVLWSLSVLIPATPRKHTKALAQRAAAITWDAVQRIRTAARKPLPKRVKLELLDANAGRVACAYCGYRFSRVAVERLEGRSAEEPPLPPTVDIAAPRGLVSKDLLIEIDHVVPVAQGGSNDLDNLRLACGWCNRNKHALSSIGDLASSPIPMHTPALGGFGAPKPFWVVRVRATVGHCEHPGDCDATVNTTELFVAPANPLGAWVPGNLMVVCGEHDPLGRYRFVAAADYPRSLVQRRTYA